MTKEYIRKYNKRRYHEMTPEQKKVYNKKINQRGKERETACHMRAIILKGGACERCGYNKCISALDFHHKDPTKKEAKLCRLWRRPWATISKEIAKCELLCSNCHREEHWNQEVNPTLPLLATVA